jgi:23S rRNA (guanosine2251-2'-O)-methyltransferase
MISGQNKSYGNLFPVYGIHPVLEYLLSLKEIEKSNPNLFRQVIHDAQMALANVQKSETHLDFKEMADFAAMHKMPIISLNRGEMDQISNPHAHQGIILFTPSPILRNLNKTIFFQELELKLKKEKNDPDARMKIVIIDGINDVQNFGAICRSAVALGAPWIVVAEDSPFKISPHLYKISAGAFSWIRLIMVQNIRKFCEELLQYPIPLILSVADQNAPSIYQFSDRQSIERGFALVIGNEYKGIRPSLRKLSSYKFQLPMPGQIKSINASHAATAMLALLNSLE